jgi:hypothetical protein
MMRRLLIALCVCCGLAATATGASAASIYQYASSFDPTGAANTTAGGSIGIYRLNTGLTTKITLTPPGQPALPDVLQAAGPDSYSTVYTTGLLPGTKVEIRQPQGAVAPTETYVVPTPTVNLVPGATTLSGSIPAGMFGSVIGDYRCNLNASPHTLGAGAFSVPYSKVLPGENAQISAYNANGDSVYVYNSAPGETPCVTVFALDTSPIFDPPGSPVDAQPYSLYVNHLKQTQAASTRTVLRRGTTTISDDSEDAQNTNSGFGVKPQPGDVVDIYRPKTAPTPKFSITLPSFSAKFDPAVDLAAVDVPAADKIEVEYCMPYACEGRSSRGAMNTPAGRTLFDFARPEGRYIPADLVADSALQVYFDNADETLSIRFLATPGDLVAPVQSFKLPSKLKISSLVKALKKGYKLKLKSNEAGMVTLSLGKLATVTKPVKPGSNIFRLKFTKSGKKQIKKLAKKGKKAKPLSVTLTSVVTDAEGNASTFAKKTSIKR